MDDTPISDLVKIEGWRVQIEWTLTHAKPNAVCYRTSESSNLEKNVGMVGMEIAKSET